MSILNFRTQPIPTGALASVAAAIALGCQEAASAIRIDVRAALRIARWHASTSNNAVELGNATLALVRLFLRFGGVEGGPYYDRMQSSSSSSSSSSSHGALYRALALLEDATQALTQRDATRRRSLDQSMSRFSCCR